MNEELKNNKVSLKKFYIRRVLRIFPAYYTLLFIYFLLQHFNVIYLSSASWTTALLYSKFLNHSLDTYSAHLWSLSVEEWFYFFWPFIFVFFPKKRRVFAMFIIIIVPVIRIYAYHHHKISFLDISELTLFHRADTLMIGCLMALYYEKALLISTKIFSFVK